VTLVLAIGAVYVAIGVIFALWFAASGVDRFDRAARGAGITFRALIFPGAAALWPVLLAKVRRSAKDE
jgi:hypothetical protein